MVAVVVNVYHGNWWPVRKKATGHRNNFLHLSLEVGCHFDCEQDLVLGTNLTELCVSGCSLL